MAMVLGAALAVVLELVWPGAWHRGSTPRFLVTMVLILLTLIVLRVR
jgi:hypothetical protein